MQSHWLGHLFATNVTVDVNDQLEKDSQSCSFVRSQLHWLTCDMAGIRILIELGTCICLSEADKYHYAIQILRNAFDQLGYKIEIKALKHI